jgi:ketosteroid isomerase-like protein
MEREMNIRDKLAIAGLLSLSVGSGQSLAAVQPTPAIAAKIEAEVAEMIAGINSKNADEATRYDAPNVVFMESFSPPAVGRDTDRAGFVDSFKRNQGWHITKVDETVDVAKSGDLAVYRGTYDEDGINNGVLMTHRVNYIAGFRHDPDGVWRVYWAVVNPQERSHKK